MNRPSPTILSHGGRWSRRGNAIVLDLGATASAKGSESELDFESEDSSIPAYDYLRWAQGSMNLYFEQKGRRERSPADGKDSTGYRRAVKLFKNLAGLKPENDKVDEKTQNALILANERNPKYRAWLRSALDKVGYAHLTIAYAKTEKPVAAIREFQKDHSGRFGFNLNADGFVGAKTHLALLHTLYALKSPEPKPEVDWITIVKDMPLATLKVEAKERERLGCLRNFLLRALRGAPVDDRYKTLTDVGVHHFVQDFQRRCAGKQGTKLAICFRGLHNDVLAPINYIMGKLMSLRILEARDGCICKSEECEAGRHFLAKARQVSPESLYTCFRNVIEPGFQICRKPCPRC